MTNIGIKFAAAALLAMALEGCASDYDPGQLPREPGRRVVQGGTGKSLQCVPYAREHSGVKLAGDAGVWWDEADGRYPRSSTPSAGAVMVLNNYAGAGRGHVAVVRTVIGSREIRVDHANWLNDGAVYLNDPVADVSQANDWSAVRVWNIRDGGWGVKVYPVQGFIAASPNPQARPAPHPARRPLRLENGESPPDQLVQEQSEAPAAGDFAAG